MKRDVSKLHLLALLASVFLVNCGGGGSDSGGSEAPPSSLQLTDTVISSQATALNTVTFSFPVAPSTTAAQLVAFFPNGILQLRSLSGPTGPLSLASLTSGAQSATNPSNQVSTVQLPLVGTTLVPGTYVATFDIATSTFSPIPPGTPIQARLLEKTDSDLARGTVQVNLVLVGPVAGSEELQRDLREAADKARAVFNQADIELSFEFIGVDGPETVPDPRLGDPLYEQISNVARQQSIHIAIAGDVRGLDGEEQALAISTMESQPGVPSTRSVSALSIREVAGSDGRFNFQGDGASQIFDDEIEVAGEEIAQLIGHALGLQHIIELDGDRVVRTDNLNDTPSCVTFVDCREERDIRENFMFPVLLAIPGEGRKTYSRTRITTEQANRLHQSILVD